MAQALQNFTELRINDSPVGVIESVIHTPSHPSNTVVNTVIGNTVTPNFMQDFTDANCKSEIVLAKAKTTISILKHLSTGHNLFEYTLVSSSDAESIVVKNAFIVEKPEYDATSIKVTFTGIEGV